MRIKYNSVFTDDFKFNSYTLNFLMPLTEKNATYSALLAQVLKRGCRKYGEMDQIVARMEELYGASIDICSDKIGENLSFTVRGVFLDNSFAVEKEDICGGLLDVLSELLLHPILENGVFCKKYFDQEKQNHADLIKGIINDKRTYSIVRCKEIMFSDRQYRFTANGTLDCLEKITVCDLYDFYTNLLQNSTVLVSYIGRKTDVEKLTEHYFPPILLGNESEMAKLCLCTAGDLKETVEELDVAQGKLCMGFRFDARVERYAARLFNVIYGGSPTSKLFMNVRERLSLCYYCSSAIDIPMQCMIVSSGIEFDNYTVAREEILNQLKDMQNGAITEEEFENGKTYLLDYIAGIKDSHAALLSDIISGYVIGTRDDIETQKKKIKELSMNDVIEVAGHVVLDTVYFLKGKNE